MGPLEAACPVPGGFQIARVKWHSTEMKEAVTVEHEASESSVSFTIPRLIVYGLSITSAPTDRAESVAHARLLGCPAAVYRQVLSRHVAGPLAGQKYDRALEFLRVPHPPHRAFSFQAGD